MAISRSIKQFLAFIVVCGVIGAIISLIYYFVSHSKNGFTSPDNQIGHNNNLSTEIENFAMPDKDFSKVLSDVKAPNSLTPAQKSQLLGELGCQSAIDQNMEGYRSLESGATFKIEKVTKTGSTDKYIVHTADNLVLYVEPNTGRLSRAIKDTKDDTQLFSKETVKDSTGADTTTVIFTKELATGVKLALQYEHESLSLRPLDPTGKPWRGQQFMLDVNLKGDLLDAAAMALGYRLAPGVGALDLQNAGTVAMCASGSSSTIPITPSGGATPSAMLGNITQQQLNDAMAAAVANINAFHQTTGSAQPGTLNNPFANKSLKINLNLSGLGKESSTNNNALSSMVSGFADIPNYSHAATESFTDIAANSSGTGQVRNLIKAWESAQTTDDNTDLGGIPSSAKLLGESLRGKMVSCPKIDRTQYYTEKQLSQCAGCTPDPYLRGQLGGTNYV